MTRKEVVKLAKKLGFKPWGKLRKIRGSSYQCFRRANQYAWIGYRFIEIVYRLDACDFISESDATIRKFLDTRAHDKRKNLTPGLNFGKPRVVFQNDKHE